MDTMTKRIAHHLAAAAGEAQALAADGHHALARCRANDARWLAAVLSAHAASVKRSTSFPQAVQPGCALRAKSSR